MPKVGNKEFEYTPEGITAAETEAEKTGEPVIRTYDAGGRVQKYQEGGEVAEPFFGGAMTAKAMKEALDKEDDRLLSIERLKRIRDRVGDLAIPTKRNPEGFSTEEGEFRNEAEYRRYKLREGMITAISEEFPLKGVADQEETMAIGASSLDPQTMEKIFGTSNFDDIKEDLVVDENPPDGPPHLAYSGGPEGKLLRIATIKIRQD